MLIIQCLIRENKVKKYEFTGETKDFNGVILHRIRAIKDFGIVKAGGLGGWIEKEYNLSHEGNCWVYGDARVYGDAKVSGNARVSGGACVYGNAQVYGDAIVCQEMYIKFSHVTKDLLDAKNIRMNIMAQTNFQTINSEIFCYKHVRKDLSSLHDSNFKYKVGEWIEAKDVEESNKSCASGLHVSHASYWENRGGEVVLLCKVKIEDIITVQQGKIRCRKLFVIGVCESEVF